MKVVSVPQSEQLVSRPAPPLPKGTEPHLSRSPDREMGERVKDSHTSAPINSRLNVVVRSPTPLGLGRNGCWLSRGSQLPRALPFIFLLCCPLNDRRRATHSFLKIGRLFSLSLFSCPSPSPSPYSSSSLDER